MSIEFICPTCQQQLRVPDTAAGKNAKCPKCTSILAVPSAKEVVSPLAPPPQAGFNFAPPLPSAAPPLPLAAPPKAPTPFTPSNFVAPAKQHGGGFVAPATGNPFAFDGSQIPGNKLATLPTTQGTMPALQSVQMTPGYAGGPNPYSAPQGPYLPNSGRNVRVELTPIVNHSIKMWQDNLGVLLATTLMPALVFVPLYGLMFFGFMFAAIVDPVLVVLGWLGFFVLFPVLMILQVYLSTGQMHICMLVARGQQPAVSEMFIGMDKFLSALGYTLLITPVILIAALPMYIPLIFLLLMYWPSYYLVVDRKCGVMESFNVASRIAEGNKLTAFLVLLVGGGFTLLGEMACFVGLFFAIPLVSIMWCTAYLMMSGQIPVPPRPQPYPQPYPPSKQPNYGPPGQGRPPGSPAGYLPPSGK